MEVLFVRHGETNGNIARRHQSNDTHLTQKGEEQAVAIAAQIKVYGPTHLITSPLVRAVETAEIIGTACDLIPEVKYEFAELQRPTKLFGHFHHNWRSVRYYLNWYFGFADQYLKEGESYRALRERITDARTMLEGYPDDAKVVVVSHTLFINFFLAHMCHQRLLGPVGILFVIHRAILMRNTNVAKVTYTRENRKCKQNWRLVDRRLESL